MILLCPVQAPGPLVLFYQLPAFLYCSRYLYFYNRLQTQPPPRLYNLFLPCIFLPWFFIIISFSNPNCTTCIFLLLTSASQISPWIKIYNMNLYADSAESQLLIEIQGLNNCMFGKRINIFRGGGSIELSFYFAIYFLNVMQNYVKQTSQNIYVQYLRENSKGSSTKRGNILHGNVQCSKN